MGKEDGGQVKDQGAYREQPSDRERREHWMSRLGRPRVTRYQQMKLIDRFVGLRRRRDEAQHQRD
jgi:hypothetical protein